MLVPALAYLVLNAVAYFFCFRRLRFMQIERGILIYQLLSFVFFVMLVALSTIGRFQYREAFFRICAAVGFHGIFSLSFLELWSLTEGSYSLSILTHISSKGGHSEISSLRQLSAIGSTKSKGRSEMLGSIGLLIRGSDRPAKLTTAGRIVSLLFRALVALTNGRPLNG
jgi:hypothetical protein